MAPPTVQTLQRLAAETGYRLDTLEKVLRLLELLDEIAQDPVLSQRLALKGGTTLNVFYLDLDRLSVDIDLNYVGALDLAAMERERPRSMPRSTACSPHRVTVSAAGLPGTQEASGSRATRPHSVATRRWNST